MTAREYLKRVLNERKHELVVKEVSVVEQENNNDIVMERCVLDGEYKVVIISDKDKSVLVTC